MRALTASMLVAASAICGCAAILTGVDQKIFVETRLDGVALSGATCRLTNSKGSWFVTTPGSVVVHRAGDGLEVDCTTGGIDATASSLAARGNNATFANVLLGGVGGIAIDTGTGAAYNYPERVVVDLRPRATAAGDAAPTATTALSPSVMATLKYQLAAEAYARSLACAARPIAAPTAYSADGETYAIRCVDSAVLSVRCATGTCRVVTPPSNAQEVREAASVSGSR